MRIVGEYIEEFNTLTGQSLTCDHIFQSDGLRIHIAKRHPDCVALLHDIPLILSEPDYIGCNPNEAANVELVKCLDNNLMVCVKLDQSKGYLYVATLFKISNAKLQNRLKSGRLKKFG